MNLQTEMELHVSRFERETFKPAHHKLIIKFQAFKLVVKDVLNSRRKAYEQLMLAEIELEKILPEETNPSDHALKTLESIGRAKGFLACLMLSVLIAGSCNPFSDTERARGRTRSRGKGREEFILSDFLEPEEVIA